MEKLAVFSLPIVRVVDYFAGATNAMCVPKRAISTNLTMTCCLVAAGSHSFDLCLFAMLRRCDVTSSKDPTVKATMIYGHENLEPCVGECVTGFCCAILAGVVRPGIWFPEEGITGEQDTASVLSLASVGAHTLEADTSIGIRPGELWGSEQAEQVLAQSRIE